MPNLSACGDRSWLAAPLGSCGTFAGYMYRCSPPSNNITQAILAVSEILGKFRMPMVDVIVLVILHTLVLCWRCLLSKFDVKYNEFMSCFGSDTFPFLYFNIWRGKTNNHHYSKSRFWNRNSTSWNRSIRIIKNTHAYPVKSSKTRGCIGCEKARRVMSNFVVKVNIY